ncbi:nicotinate-nucleotide adenylyltransferase [Minwuia thermotolerans]|uniref:Probable nicotinate-nucleotide adenylyltransferase n=1 Tax=Minwuia thermotolerans TaxID=2056226 RepID=A0A2M9FWY8_9PROT|nr:nicotinate-nucleotide adenylyltransferase [Minwuia thermotolerans]PJK27963.1 nicotinic acid mononucleotide adenylyltransferase [Minwuia thermotolerans]
MPHRGLRIGLLGGSFNPAHDGHRHLSLEALHRLALDEVWWLVSPQNPLKATKGMAPLARRLEFAERLARHPRIRVTDIEARMATRYTVDTLSELRRRHPDERFVWLMGADNLRQLPGWDRWTEMMALVPVAVFDREPYSWNVLTGQAATRFRRAYWRQSDVRALADAKPPAWSFIRMRRHPMSATKVRAHGATPWPVENPL